MGFFGRLEEMPLEDIVQILSMSRRTGKLSLTRGPVKAAIAFKNGDIVCAASDRVRTTLGQTLTSLGLVSEETLSQAVAVQQRWMPWRLLGSILVEMGAISEDRINEVVREQIEEVLGDLLSWSSGLFKFEPWADADGIEHDFGGLHLLFADSVTTAQTMLQAAKRLDEGTAGDDDELPMWPLPSGDPRRAGTDLPEVAPNGGVAARGAGRSHTEPPPSGSDADDIPGTSDVTGLLRRLLELEDPPAVDDGPPRTGKGASPMLVAEIALVKAIMNEIRSPRFTGEISLMVMRYAAELLRRGVLFSVRPGSVGVLAEFGLEDGASGERATLRSSPIPLRGAAALRPAIEFQRTERGRTLDKGTNGALLDLLGGTAPREFVTVPMIVDGEAMAVLYGDNYPEDNEIGSVEGLELLMIHAGLCLERQRLVNQLLA